MTHPSASSCVAVARETRLERHDAVGAATPMLPGSGHLARQLLGLGLGCHLDRLAAGRLCRPALDLNPPDVLAFGEGLPCGLLAEEPEGLEVGKVGAQPPICELADRRVRAQVAVEALEHVLVSRDGRALQALLTLALGKPVLRGLSERTTLLLSVLVRLGFWREAPQDLRETILRVLRRQVFRRRAGPAPRAPYDRSAWRPSTRIPDMRRTQPTSTLLPVLIAPERPERPRAAIPVDLDLQMRRGARSTAHDVYDLHELETANEFGERASDFPTISPAGLAGPQMTYISRAKTGLLEPI